MRGRGGERQGAVSSIEVAWTEVWSGEWRWGNDPGTPVSMLLSGLLNVWRARANLAQQEESRVLDGKAYMSFGETIGGMIPAG
jgi:hypothetical protein